MEFSEELSPATIARYRRQLDRLGLPELGGIELGLVPVGRLTRETVMSWDLAAKALPAPMQPHTPLKPTELRQRGVPGTRPEPGPEPPE